jgi:DNA-binding IclR family transcriptional regulator
MRGRMGLFIGMGAGYVLGAKAGRERYVQLQRLYDNLTSSPTFRRAKEKAKQAAGSGLGTAAEAAGEGVSKVASAVRGRSDERSGGLSVAPPPQP